MVLSCDQEARVSQSACSTCLHLVRCVIAWSRWCSPAVGSSDDLCRLPGRPAGGRRQHLVVDRKAANSWSFERRSPYSEKSQMTKWSSTQRDQLVLAYSSLQLYACYSVLFRSCCRPRRCDFESSAASWPLRSPPCASTPCSGSVRPSHGWVASGSWFVSSDSASSRWCSGQACVCTLSPFAQLPECL